MTYSPDSVFLDYLTVTNRPDNSCIRDVQNYFVRNGAFIDSDYNGRVSVYLSPLKNMQARIQLKEAKRFVSISATGSALHFLRVNNLFNDYLNILASVPHNVTRLDVALDVPIDAPPILKSISDRYSTGEVQITRKAVPITRLIAVRSDGQETGTIYFGKRGKSRVIARIYDKQWEQLQRFGNCTAPMTRYELEFGRGYNTSLKDASEPYLLFWNHAGSFGLDLPIGLPPWTPGGEFSRYEKMPVPELLPLEVLTRRVNNSTEIATLYHLSQELGSNGLQALKRVLIKRLDELASETSGSA